MIRIKNMRENQVKSKKVVKWVLLIVIAVVITFFILYFYFAGHYPNSDTYDIYSRDVAIKSYLTGLRREGGLYAQENNSYKGFCNSKEVTSAIGSIKNKDSQLFCNDNQEEWAVCAQLVQWDKDKYFCSDSIGTAQTIPGECNENWDYTSCP